MRLVLSDIRPRSRITTSFWMKTVRISNPLQEGELGGSRTSTLITWSLAMAYTTPMETSSFPSILERLASAYAQVSAR